MRKDLFIVGARLLGIWQLLGAANSLASMIGFWYGYMQLPAYNQQYNNIHFVIELAGGLFLIFGTHFLFDLMDRIKPEGDKVEIGEAEIKQ
jgi:hypothetical protein